MKKKKIAALITSLALVGVVVVGGTLAYLTAQTDELKNVFTVGNISIDIEEPDWNPDDADELYPGAEVKKNPIISNIGKNSGYMVMEVSGLDEMTDFAVSYGEEDWNTVDWSYVVKEGDRYVVAEKQPEALVDGFYVYKEAVDAGKETTPLFDKVTFIGKETTVNYVIKGVDENEDGVSDEYVIEGVDGTFATKEEAQAKVNELATSETLTFSLNVKGYAIQDDGFTSMEDAINELLK